MTTPDEPVPENVDEAAGDDEVARLQRDLDVANDCTSGDAAGDEEPPGDPAG